MNIEIFWNHIYYSIYIFESKSQKAINNVVINFAYILFKHQFTKLGKTNKTVMKEGDVVLNDSKYGLSINIANAIMLWLVASGDITIFNVVKILVHQDFFSKIWSNIFYKIVFIVMIMAVIPLWVNYHFLWKKDKYLKYFKQFNRKDDSKELIKWQVIKFVFIIFSILFLIMSILISDKN